MFKRLESFLGSEFLLLQDLIRPHNFGKKLAFFSLPSNFFFWLILAWVHKVLLHWVNFSENLIILLLQLLLRLVQKLYSFVQILFSLLELSYRFIQLAFKNIFLLSKTVNSSVQLVLLFAHVLLEILAPLLHGLFLLLVLGFNPFDFF